MGKNILTYKGYSTRVEYSTEDNVLYGKIEGIADLVNFESETTDGVEAAFHEAVDDYLAFCADIGQEPDKEYKGTFNVRIKPQLHRELDRAAYAEGVSMNQFIENALVDYMEQYKQEPISETYQIMKPTASNALAVLKPMWEQSSSNIVSLKEIGNRLQGSRQKQYN